MAMRPPQTPRALNANSTAGNTPNGLSTSRRKSALPVRPPSSLSNSSSTAAVQNEMNSLKEAIRHHDPTQYTQSPSHSPTPNGTLSTRQRQLNQQQQQQQSTASTGKPALGDHVSFTVGATTMKGIVRFLGPVQGKDGHWAGVELDEEWHGKGKNDGSVQGVAYFECPDRCGLFLPISKLVVLTPPPLPPSKSASQAALSRITAGSRASKYVGMTAKELASQKRTQATTTTTPTATRSFLRAPSASPPKRSPEKASLSASTTSNASTSAGTTFATPRGKPRTSMALPTPSTVRKTPRLSVGPSSVRRPSSSMRSASVTMPDVPPIPAPFARSITPAGQRAAIGRGMAPLTPSGIRRPSLAAAGTASDSRPTTPSVNGRSVSRQSFASSMSASSSRHSGRSSVLGHSTSSRVVGLNAADEDERRREEQLQAALEREKELRKLLEGSEKIGREMEDQLADARDQLRKSVARVSTLEKGSEEEEASAAQAEEEKNRLLQVEGTLAVLQQQLDERDQASSRLAQEWQTKLAARDSEIEALRDRMQAASADHDEHRKELESELAKLRSAGQALCATYEERIAEIENDRIAAVEQMQEVSAKLEAREKEATVPNASLAASLGGASTAAAAAERDEAARIDAETARADIAHLTDKVRQLEDELDERRDKFESEIDELNKRAARASENESRLKKEVSTLMVSLEEASKAEARASARIAEVEEALRESRAQLERERAELEGLRNEASASASAAVSEDLARANKQLGALRTQHAAVAKEAEDARTSAAESALLVEELRASLKLAEADLDKARDQSPSKDDHDAMREQIVGLKVLVSTLTDENRDLRDKHDALAKATSTNDDESLAMLKTELTSLRDELKQVREAAAQEKETYNQDIADLEALVEAKLYREEELEDELEKYKGLVAAPAPAAPLAATSTSAATSAQKTQVDPVEKADSSSSKAAVNGDDADVSKDECEMCGELGHDLDSCPEFGGTGLKSHTTATAKPAPRDAKEQGEYCDDCEEYGHSLENCPLANEIF